METDLKVTWLESKLAQMNPAETRQISAGMQTHEYKLNVSCYEALRFWGLFVMQHSLRKNLMNTRPERIGLLEEIIIASLAEGYICMPASVHRGEF